MKMYRTRVEVYLRNNEIDRPKVQIFTIVYFRENGYDYREDQRVALNMLHEDPKYRIARNLGWYPYKIDSNQELI